MLSVLLLGNLGQIPESQERNFASRKRNRLAANPLAILHDCGISLAGKTQNVTHFTERAAPSMW